MYRLTISQKIRGNLHRSYKDNAVPKQKDSQAMGAGLRVGRETVTLEVPNGGTSWTRVQIWALSSLAATANGKLNELHGFHYLVRLVMKYCLHSKSSFYF